jgi:7-carboxy-7-deazaguanine synthase
MKVCELFYTLQGEGVHAGTPAVFLRFSGCNLACPFCDTDFSDGTYMTEEEIADRIATYPATLVVVTGGEPSLQLTSTLVDRIHALGKKVAVETNGTHPLPAGVDWITCSPKSPYVGEAGRVVLTHVDELKVIYDGEHEISDLGIVADHYFVQPCDVGDEARNSAITRGAMDFVIAHPRWHLSVQLHKLLGFR